MLRAADGSCSPRARQASQRSTASGTGSTIRSGLERQCAEGRACGFDGKSLIHPGQIDIANRAFGPSEEEVEAAHRLIAAATGGAERFEGRMIEAMHVRQAEDLLAKARR